jgi:serine/threonine protein kinase
MTSNTEETALLLIHATFRTKLYIALENCNINGIFPEGKKTYMDMLESHEYKFDYAIIDYEYNEFSKVVEDIKTKGVIPIVAYDKHKVDESGLNNLVSNHSYILEKGGVVREFPKLIMKIKDNELTTKADKNERYQFIRNVGSGANATVDLYKDMEENRFVAVKKISLEGETETSKKKLKSEFENMEKIKCPTVIESYATKIENNQMYIYLEFADGGTLDDKISELRIKGKRLSFELIRDFTIDILLALFVMNKNHMIHRDVKSENILINTENVAKLCDLGISRVVGNSYGAQFYTVCGTPYYISPEIVSEVPYGIQTDIWSLGVVVYEMVTGSKPFDKVNGIDLYTSIKKDDYPTLPFNTDHRLAFIIDAMLKKDPEKRYNIKQLLALDFMYDRLLEKLYQSRWIERVPEFEELIQIKKVPLYDQVISNTFSTEDVATLQEVFEVFYNTPFSSFKKSMFSGAINNCKKGSDLELTFNDDEKFSKKYKNEQDFYEKLMEMKILTSLKESHTFGDSDYYVFSFDNSVYDNNVKIDNPDIFISSSLESKMNNLNINNVNSTKLPDYYDLVSLTKATLYEGIFLVELTTDRDDKKKLELITHRSFSLFNLGLSLFKNFNIMTLGVDEKIAALLNIYQIMVIHTILNMYLGNTFSTHQSGKIYKFADMTLSDQEIKHAVFRGNKKPPGSYFRVVYNTDLKTQILPDNNDPRVLLILYENDQKILDNYRLRFIIFHPEHLERNFEELCLHFISNYVTFEQGQIEFPTFIEPYISDFNDATDLLKLLANAYNVNKQRPEICKLPLQEEQLDYFTEIDSIIEGVKTGELKITYEVIN